MDVRASRCYHGTGHFRAWIQMLMDTIAHECYSTCHLYTTLMGVTLNRTLQHMDKSAIGRCCCGTLQHMDTIADGRDRRL